MLLSSVISYGLAETKKKKKAEPITGAASDTAWFESLERSRKSFGLEGVSYEYWHYPATQPEGSFWIKSNKRVVVLLSDAFLKTATESQVVAMMESLSADSFHEVQQENRKKALRLFFNSIKGESRHYRYWISSFFLYPLERLFKIARI